ncbi:ankyrin repeat and SOCS box protein 2-like [Sebastes fasciatus]|uniref:ankyrin repeat and SOCS box protein 2-like n=1 Tax=Sebastes fasciatus TaxID=394691 RepID=UPI003D9DD385
MAAMSEVNLDDYSVYSSLSDEELLHIAVERSLSDKHWPSDCDQTSSSSSSSSSSARALPTRTSPNPRRRHPDPPRHLNHGPPSRPPPPAHPGVSNCANPPTGLFPSIYRPVRREITPLQSMIMNGDSEALLELVERGSGSETEPSDEGWIALHEAAYYGQLECVTILIGAHPDSVNRCTLKNKTALVLAAGRGNVSCVDFLLKNGADLEVADKDRETPLFAACEEPNEAIVDLLLRSGARVNRCNIQGVTALHEACRHGQLKLCRKLLESGADHHAKNIYGIRPMFTAAQLGHVNIIQLLAKKGADINGQAGDGASPLFEACKNGHVCAADELLSLKADANRSTTSGLLPLHVAVQNNHSRVVSLLIPATSRVKVQNSGISPLHIAAENNWDDIMELLIESGFDVNAKLSEDHSEMYEDRRSTAVYSSVYNGNIEAVEMLLEAGADPNLDVFNPLLIAVRLGRMDIATLLLKYGADANAKIPTQPSSFPVAILLRMETLPMLKLLLDNGCDARPCFDCPYGQKPHPPVMPSRSRIDEMRISRVAPPQRCVQFCEAVSSLSSRRAAGPIISMLLDYVSHVRLCSRLLEVLESHSDWPSIKLKARPPHPLMQLCRLEIRRLVGVRRLKLLHTLPLPVRLIRFLLYDVAVQAPEV